MVAVRSRLPVGAAVAVPVPPWPTSGVVMGAVAGTGGWLVSAPGTPCGAWSPP